MRYNIFNQVHRPLKEALLSACISLSTNTGSNESSAFDAVRKVEEVLEICDEQVKYEAVNILPYIFEYEPSVWNTYISEHYKVMNLCRDIKSRVQSIYKLKHAKDRSTALKLLGEAFNEFVMMNYNHMDDEEAVLNEILWRYYNDALIREMENEMMIINAAIKQPKKKGLQMANAA